MHQKLIQINKIEHKNKTIKKVKDFSFAKKLISSPIGISEFFEACKDYTIFFTKDSNDQNRYIALALLGYKENENVFIDSDSNWLQNKYCPSYIRRYPFRFIPSDDPKAPTLAVEEEYLSDSKDFDPLFENENNTEYLNNVLTFLSMVENDYTVTNDFIKQLADMDLLEEKNAAVKKDDKVYNVGPLLVVNEEKLNHLGKKKKEMIFEKNLLPFITAHLISLSNIQRIANM